MTTDSVSPPATPFDVMVCLMIGMSDTEIDRELGGITKERIQQVRQTRDAAIAKQRRCDE